MRSRGTRGSRADRGNRACYCTCSRRRVPAPIWCTNGRPRKLRRRELNAGLSGTSAATGFTPRRAYPRTLSPGQARTYPSRTVRIPLHPVHASSGRARRAAVPLEYTSGPERMRCTPLHSALRRKSRHCNACIRPRPASPRSAQAGRRRMPQRCCCLRTDSPCRRDRRGMRRCCSHRESD